MIAGEFTIFAKTARVIVKSADVIVEHTDFVGKYELHPRTMSSQEKQLIPVLPEWYIIPQEVVDICKHAQATTGKDVYKRQRPMRFML